MRCSEFQLGADEDTVASGLTACSGISDLDWCSDSWLCYESRTREGPRSGECLGEPCSLGVGTGCSAADDWSSAVGCRCWRRGDLDGRKSRSGDCNRGSYCIAEEDAGDAERRCKKLSLESGGLPPAEER
ncbi:hypothetical protein B296_00051412 [Ensete ventricosum]|uniref:Uncharacterized protein n=1 Tax=Ensete ventricosum TaxID=4639 RepID=A0A426YH06_ENSVE|nr:hypothetical protein B296_00051412 [Ensete ventricosum]